MKPWKSLALAVVLLGSGALARDGEQSPARSEVEEPPRPLTTPPAPPPLEPPKVWPAPSRGKRSPSTAELTVIMGGMLLFMAGFFYLSIRLGLWLVKRQKQPPPYLSPPAPPRGA